MTHNSLKAVLSTLDHRLNRTEKLANAAYRWSTASTTILVYLPKFTAVHRDIVVEAAYLQAFIAWEAFLEESFVLYVCGKRLPRQRNLRCLCTMRTRAQAENFIIPEGKEYAEWTKTTIITDRAIRFFEGGRPYTNVLRPHQSKLDHMRFIRNAIAHASKYSQEKFQEIVRSELKTLPPRLTIGGFLITTKPHSSPPTTFLEDYLSYLRLMSQQIIPI